jgi:hypothetical protein
MLLGNKLLKKCSVICRCSVREKKENNLFAIVFNCFSYWTDNTEKKSRDTNSE